VWVSAHPDVILKMGVKEVLYHTKHLGWGTDTHLYRTALEFNEQFPQRLQAAGPRVLKQNRGNDGQGVWKAELVSAAAHKAAVVSRAACAPRQASVHQELAFAEALELWALQTELVWQLTDHLSDDVLQCHNAHVAAELIDHDGKVRLPVTEKRQRILQRHHLGSDDKLPFNSQQARLRLVQLCHTAICRLDG
jgi:hypothetical protein